MNFFSSNMNSVGYRYVTQKFQYQFIINYNIKKLYFDFLKKNEKFMQQVFCNNFYNIIIETCGFYH